ncbi:Surfeit locus protein 1 [Portunus trituberculatus]|uniref:SURF1-like protein n=1 Tax=Portunus trituberculatus TaxID=210409 RepID=A0A5B7JIH3_PORTR|nr:Surfeit locus protein 1 [Portunus trituberculatus]
MIRNDFLAEMSRIICQGVKIGKGILFIAQRTTHSAQPLRRSCPVVLGLPTLRLAPVRRMATSTAAPGNHPVGPMGLFLLIVPIGTFCLGTWQVQRRKWKLNLIDELATKSKAPPIQFPENLEELEELEYRRVKMIGTFDHSREILLGPRPALVKYSENKIYTNRKRDVD